ACTHLNVNCVLMPGLTQHIRTRPWSTRHRVSDPAGNGKSDRYPGHARALARLGLRAGRHHARTIRRQVHGRSRGVHQSHSRSGNSSAGIKRARHYRPSVSFSTQASRPPAFLISISITGPAFEYYSSPIPTTSTILLEQEAAP